MIIIFWRAATASAALPSCRSPRTALNTVSPTRTRPVPYSFSGQMLTSPATSSTTCMTSAYCRRKARHRGSVSASANRFGP